MPPCGGTHICGKPQMAAVLPGRGRFHPITSRLERPIPSLCLPRRVCRTGSAKWRVAQSSSDHQPVEPDAVIEPKYDSNEEPALDDSKFGNNQEGWEENSAKEAELSELVLALVPVLVSAGAVFWRSGQFDILRFALLAGCSLLVGAWASITGSIFNALSVPGSPLPAGWQGHLGGPRVQLVVGQAALLAAAGLFYFVAKAEGPLVGRLFYAAVACAYAYMCPPFRLMDRGAGEPLVFLGAGPLAFHAFYLALGGLGPDLVTILLSTLVGASAAIVSLSSYFPTAHSDELLGKRNPIARIGTESGSKVLMGLVTMVKGASAVCGIFRLIPLICWTSSIISYGAANSLTSFVEQHKQDPAQLRQLQSLASKWCLLFNCTLVLGLVLARAMGG